MEDIKVNFDHNENGEGLLNGRADALFSRDFHTLISGRTADALLKRLKNPPARL